MGFSNMVIEIFGRNLNKYSYAKSIFTGTLVDLTIPKFCSRSSSFLNLRIFLKTDPLMSSVGAHGSLPYLMKYLRISTYLSAPSP